MHNKINKTTVNDNCALKENKTYGSTNKNNNRNIKTVNIFLFKIKKDYINQKKEIIISGIIAEIGNSITYK